MLRIDKPQFIDFIVILANWSISSSQNVPLEYSHKSVYIYAHRILYHICNKDVNYPIKLMNHRIANRRQTKRNHRDTYVIRFWYRTYAVRHM